MTKRQILFCGHPLLRRKAKRIHTITPAIVELLADMTQTMIEAPGVGLAAPQVGESVRAIVVRDDVAEDSEVFCLLNPRVVARSGKAEALEGCLSLPTLHGTVLRSADVVVEGTDLDGREVHIESEGLLARALQHEIDHLNGVLFIDRAEPDSLGWMVPDEEEEDGYRIDPVTVAEVIEVFARLREQKERQ